MPEQQENGLGGLKADARLRQFSTNFLRLILIVAPSGERSSHLMPARGQMELDLSGRWGPETAPAKRPS